MNFEKLNKNNFLLYAVKSYENPSCCGVDDFNEDIKAFSTFKRSLKISIKKIQSNVEDKSLRSLVNKLVILNNIFGIIPTQRLIYFYMDPMYHSFIYTIYRFLNIANDPVVEMDKDAIVLKNILKTIEDEING